MLTYTLTSVPLTFAHIDGHKISPDKSTLFSKLEVRIITDAPRNIDACIFDGMFMIFHEDCLLADNSLEIPFLIFSKIRKDVGKFVVCSSCDWRFKG